MKTFRADLHIHSVLSPCSGFLMTPGKIIDTALERGLDMIAITDHNSAANLAAALKLAEKTPLKIIPGMEVESAEEVHLLCYFEELADILQWQELVYESLPGLKNDPETFGYQILTDFRDNYQTLETRLLAAAAGMGTEEIVSQVRAMGGMVVPAHIDRPYNSLLASLGFLPPEPDFPLLEIARGSSPEELRERFPALQGKTLIKNSDSHFPEEIKPWLELRLQEASFRELVLAARGERGREISLPQGDPAGPPG